MAHNGAMPTEKTPFTLAFYGTFEHAEQLMGKIKERFPYQVEHLENHHQYSSFEIQCEGVVEKVDMEECIMMHMSEYDIDTDNWTMLGGVCLCT